MIAIALVIVILARPQSTNSWQNSSTEGIDIMMAIDISSSMLAQDLRPNRLEAAKNVAAAFINGRPNDNIGLVVFSAESFTIFVSWLGELPMAAMSFNLPVNLCAFATLECVGGGAAALMGRHLGQHDPDTARHIARSALALLYLVCLLSTPMLLSSVSGVLFGVLGAGGDPELLRLCWLYNLLTQIGRASCRERV